MKSSKSRRGPLAASSPSDIRETLDIISEAFRILARQLGSGLAASAVSAAPAAARATASPAASLAPRAKAPLSAARRKALAFQAQYMVAIRSLPPKSKDKVRAIREKSGVEAAIRAASRMGKGTSRR